MEEENAMTMVDNLKYELEGRLLPLSLGKTHLSVRWEAMPRIARVGVCLDEYTWDNRERVINALLDFEGGHADEFALEFDVIPLEGVNDASFADA